jgi:hypothetical protein
MKRAIPVWLLMATYGTGPAPAEPQKLRLMLSGGPARADIEVEINGEFAVLIADSEPELFHKIDDMLKPGLNQLKVLLKQPEAARSAGEDIRIAITPVQENERRTRTTGDSLAELIVPGDLDPHLPTSRTSTGCSSRVRPLATASW